MGNSSMNTMKKKAVAAALAAGLLGGGAAGHDHGQHRRVRRPGDHHHGRTAGRRHGSGDTATDAGRPDSSEHFTSALAPLVEDGTITQAQADAVIAALAEAGPPEGGGATAARRRDGRPRWPGPRHAPPRRSASPPTSCAPPLEGGQTIAEVAASKGVDVQTVIDAMVAGLKTHLDEEVASGEHTQAEADQKLADATERITDSVNNGFPERGERPADAPQEDTATN